MSTEVSKVQYEFLRRAVSDNGEACVAGVWQLEAPPVCLDLGPVDNYSSIPDQSLPPCPDCGGQLWPDADDSEDKVCKRCRSLFETATWESQSKRISTILCQWRYYSGHAIDSELNLLGSGFAKQLGLPVLAAIYNLLQMLESAKEQQNQSVSVEEMTHYVSRLLLIAKGEADVRTHRAVTDSFLCYGTPGLVADPGPNIL